MAADCRSGRSLKLCVTRKIREDAPALAGVGGEGVEVVAGGDDPEARSLSCVVKGGRCLGRLGFKDRLEIRQGFKDERQEY